MATPSDATSGAGSRPPRRGKRRALVAAVLVAVLLAAGVATQWRGDLPLETVRARWATGASRFIEVDGLRIHVRERGSGPVLLLLHGSNSSLFTWQGWVTELSGEHRVISFDLPGHGLTGPDPKGRYSHAEMAELVDHVATALGVSRFSLAGNSMGGHLAIVYALAHPERVEKLILVDSHGLHREEPPPLIFRLAGAPVLGHVLARLSPRFVIAGNVRSVYGDPGKVTDALVDRYQELLLRDGNREALRIRFATQEEEVDPAQLRTLKMPVLILWGAQDRWVLPKYGERMRDAIPGSRLITFAGLGHVPMEEDPVATARPVREFLRN